MSLLGVGVCRAISRVVRSQGDVEYQPMCVEASVIPAATVPRSSCNLIVFQDQPPVNGMTVLAEHALESIRLDRESLRQIMKERATRPLPTTVTGPLSPLPVQEPGSSLVTTNTTRREEEQAAVEADLAVDLFVPQPKFHIAFQCPVSERSYDMSLATAAVFVGVMIGAPINPKTAF